MTDCSEIRPLLSAFGDGELAPAELLTVARHLAGCATCEQEAADFASLGNQLRTTVEASVGTLALDNLTASVQARIDQLRPSVWSRFGLWLQSIDERMSSTFSLASAVVAMAALTALILTPYARNYTIGRSATVVASAHVSPISPAAPTQLANAIEENPVVADSKAIISRLESQNPSVAVWSEPRTDTTVIWLPDQQR
ncbi:MAG: zf-HC2 domain-containing protein [Candidatus Binataceae bacterium]|nr:zf-HC2 domain-containing protein [Candidatus Binataceae bacterium]